MERRASNTSIRLDISSHINAQAERPASSRTAQACCWTAQRLRCRLLLPSSASRHKALLVIANEADLISDLRDERYLLDGLLVGSRPREHVRDFLDFALFRAFHDLGTIRLACLVLHRVAIHADSRRVDVSCHLAIV